MNSTLNSHGMLALGRTEVGVYFLCLHVKLYTIFVFYFYITASRIIFSFATTTYRKFEAAMCRRVGNVMLDCLSL